MNVSGCKMLDGLSDFCNHGCLLRLDRSVPQQHEARRDGFPCHWRWSERACGTSETATTVLPHKGCVLGVDLFALHLTGSSLASKRRLDRPTAGLLYLLRTTPDCDDRGASPLVNIPLTAVSSPSGHCPENVGQYCTRGLQ